VRQGIGVAPGTNPHADVAIGAHLAPVVKAGFGVQLPASGAVDDLLIVRRYGIGRAAVGAFFANLAEIFNPDIDGAVRNQWQVGGYGTQSNPRAEVFGHQIP